jgi:hypothetical protein
MRILVGCAVIALAIAIALVVQDLNTDARDALPDGYRHGD